MWVLRSVLFALLFATTTLGHSASPYPNFINALQVAEPPDEQMQVITSIRQMLQSTTPDSRYAKRIVYTLFTSPALGSDPGIGLLQDLIALPTVNEDVFRSIAQGIGNRRRLPIATLRLLQDLLMQAHLTGQLPDSTFDRLGSYLRPRLENPDAREVAWQVLSTTLASDNRYPRYLEFASKLLHQKVPLKLRQASFDVVVRAIDAGQFSHQSAPGVIGIAETDPHLPLRLAAWPYALHLFRIERGYHWVEQRILQQLRLSHRGGNVVITELLADAAFREQAIGIVQAHRQLIPPDNPRALINTWVDLVVHFGSLKSLEMVEEFRRKDGLSAQHLQALSDIKVEDAQVLERVRRLRIPNLEPGSMVGLESVLRASKNNGERAQAADTLLAQYPTGVVPMEVADLAYAALAKLQRSEALASLVARGDESIAARESKILHRTPYRIVGPSLINTLIQLHGDDSMEKMLLRYCSDTAHDEGLRSAIISRYGREANAGEKLPANIQSLLIQTAMSAQSSGTVSSVKGVFVKAARRYPGVCEPVIETSIGS